MTNPPGVTGLKPEPPDTPDRIDEERIRDLVDSCASVRELDERARMVLAPKVRLDPTLKGLLTQAATVGPAHARFAWVALVEGMGVRHAIQLMVPTHAWNAFLRWHLDRTEWDDWGVEALSVAVDYDPDLAWEAIVRGTRVTTSDVRSVGTLAVDPLGMLGAGILEDFLSEHGAEFIDRIESEAPTNWALRTSLRAAWLDHVDDNVARRLRAVIDAD